MLRNKKILLISLMVLLAAVSYYFYNKNRLVLNADTVAVVNGKPILKVDFEEKLNNIKMNYPPDKMSNFAEIKQTILRRMIIDELILQDAKDKNIKVSDDELNRYIKNIKQNYTNDEFNQLLTNQFKTFEDWSAETRRMLLIEKTLSKEIMEKINIPDKELKDYYDKFYANKTSEPRVKLAQIFTATKEPADKALEELKAGANFEALAKKYSEAPEGKKGGLIGYINKGEGLEIFDRTFDMQPGETTGVIQSDYGFHILKVLEHLPSAQVSFEEAKPFILNEIVRNKESKYYEEWLGKQFKGSKIFKNTALIDSIK
ncbi:MAG: SurA N-terminal domain-containing protein [Proteobacteria bacterium]|nr:SurA N-terminal domain-containing protein [Pseudomonadota bacterium]